MNMSTLESFYFPDGKMISPERISDSVFIIPKKYDKAKIRLEVKKLMASHGCSSIMVPELKTLFEIAMEKTGIAKGSVIMKDDFQYLLDQIPGLPDKFRGHNDGYKSAIFSLLNEMAFKDESLDSYPFYGTVYSAGLDRNMCRRIFEAVRDRGFIFRAEIYRLALEQIRKDPDGRRYFLIPGEYYTQLEQSVMESLGVSVMELSDININGRITAEKVRFIRACSAMEQYSEVRNHILAMMENDTALRLDDFCLVTGDSGSLSRCTAYFTSTGMYCISSASVSAETPITDALDLVFYALNNDSEKLVLYYNRHNEEKVLYDNSYQFPMLFKFCRDISEGTLKSKLKDNERFRKWIMSSSRIENKKGTAEKNLKYLDDTVRELGFHDVSFYEYKSSLEQIFGDNEIELLDVVDYFREILSGRKKNMISSMNDGIVLVRQGEYIPACRYIYFTDLEEDTFLKDKMPNLLLSADEHDDFNRLVYGSTKEEHLMKCFQTCMTGAEHIIFVIPDYNEGTVVSEHVENILKLFPPKKCAVRVTGSRIPEFSHDFTRAFRDIGWDNVMPDKVRKNRVTGKLIFSSKTDSDRPLDQIIHKLSSVTNIETFMRCPAWFVYSIQMPDILLRDETHFDSGSAFHMFCERFFSRKDIKIFDFKKEDLDAEVSAYIMGEPCSHALSIYFDRINVRDIFRDVQSDYRGLDLNDSDLKRYLMFVCLCMKNKMKECDSESLRSEVFIGNARIIDDPDVTVAAGYIDLMFRTVSGDIVLLDFKSGDITSYKESVENLSNVQLLLYSHIVENAVRTGDLSVFVPADGQTVREGKCILEKDYFKNISADAVVDACYVSPKSDGMYVCRSGIADGYDDPFEHFTERFRKLLDDAVRNIFSPVCNSGCGYCALSPFCPDSENLQSLDSLYEQTGWQGPFLQDYPQLPPQDKCSADSEDTVKMIQFSEKEKVQAISDFDHDIIISAGAGAGKTEVLTTRYLNILLNTDADLGNILCITFTEKAAGEMKKRIFSKIRDTLSLGAFFSLDNGSADIQSYRLTEMQMKKLENVLKNFYRSNRISTFHSFCLNMLIRFEKENRNSVRDIFSKVADDYIIRNRKTEILTKLVEEYSERSDIFRRWIEYQKLYVKTATDETGIITDLIGLMDSFKLSGLTLDETTHDMLDSCFAERKDAAVSVLRTKYMNLRDELLCALEAYKEAETKNSNLRKLDDEMALVRTGNVSASSKYPYSKDAELKALADRFRKCVCPDHPECASDAEEKELHSLIFSLIMEADRKIEKYKQERNFIELADYHLNLISLMKNQNILDKIKSELRFIMVDEFQDTNWLQKEILDMIHDDSNHIFFVGDLKQSIYRFLQCDNQIFTYYRDSGKMEYLTFQDNFRSVDQIVNFNNCYFSANAVDEYNIIPHTSRSAENIEYGIPKRSDPSYPAVTFVELGYDKKSVEGIKTKDVNSLLREQEAAFIARTIVSDASRQYGKWGILVREYTNMKYILEGLRKIGIPYSFVIKREFFSQSDIRQVMNVLQVIYGYLPADTLREVPEIAGFACRLTDEDKARGFCYVVSLLISQPFYASSRPMLQEFYCMCCEFAAQLNDVPEEMIPHMLRLAETDDKEISASVENAVKIMTVHSSKGLEFDNLFVSKISQYTGKGGKSSRSSISYVNLVSGENDGRIVDYDANRIKGLKDDGSRFLYASWMDDVNCHFENIEKANLLYVAFTRAKKRLIVTMQKGEYKEDSRSPDVNWLNNIDGNIFCTGSFDNVCDMCTVRLGDIEPLKETEHQTGSVTDDNVMLPLPELLSLSVSGYLNQMEPEDDNISDSDEDRKIIHGNEIGIAVHSYFENNIHVLKNNGFDTSGECSPEKFPVAESVMEKFCRFVLGGCGNAEFRQLICEADSLKTETEIFFNTADGQLLNGIVDLIIEKGNEVIVMDYKTHTGSSLDEKTLARYMEQVRSYIHGLKEMYPGCCFSGALLIMYSNGKTELKKV